jgi:hypothetical protein
MKKQTLAKLAMMTVACGVLMSAQQPSSDASTSSNGSSSFWTTNASDNSKDFSARVDLIKAYFGARQEGNSQKWLQLFSPDAVVYSPLYNQLAPADYYKKAAADFKDLKVSIKEIFVSPEHPNVIAANYTRSFTTAAGTKEDDVIAIFTFTKDHKIKSVKYVYDTAKNK